MDNMPMHWEMLHKVRLTRDLVYNLHGVLLKVNPSASKDINLTEVFTIFIVFTSYFIVWTL